MIDNKDKAVKAMIKGDYEKAGKLLFEQIVSAWRDEGLNDKQIEVRFKEIEKQNE
jgi:hypothetical protein